jgi:hypothetical protein
LKSIQFNSIEMSIIAVSLLFALYYLVSMFFFNYFLHFLWFFFIFMKLWKICEKGMRMHLCIKLVVQFNCNLNRVCVRERVSERERECVKLCPPIFILNYCYLQSRFEHKKFIATPSVQTYMKNPIGLCFIPLLLLLLLVVFIKHHASFGAKFSFVNVRINIYRMYSECVCIIYIHGDAKRMYLFCCIFLSNTRSHSLVLISKIFLIHNMYHETMNFLQMSASYSNLFSIAPY